MKFFHNRYWIRFFDALTLTQLIPDYMKNNRGYISDYVINSKAEQALYSFISSFGYKMHKIKDNKNYTISTDDAKMKYKILLREASEGKMFILALNQDHRYELILKGNPGCLLGSLKNKNRVQNLLQNKNLATSKLILIAKRIISFDQYIELKNVLKLSGITTKPLANKTLYEILDPFLKNMKFLGICELKYWIESAVKIRIKNIGESKMNLYYFSNSNMEDTINLCISSELVDLNSVLIMNDLYLECNADK